MILKILAFIFLIPGCLTVYAARSIVERFKLEEKTKCDFAHEMTEDELRSYKCNKAIVNIKMAGMLIALPGLVMILIAFR